MKLKKIEKKYKDKSDKLNYFLIAVVLIVCVALMYSVVTGWKGTSKSKTSDKTTEKKSDVTISIDVLEENLKSTQTLITEEYDFTYVEKYTKEKKILYFINADSEFMYSYDGSVTCGIDMSKVSVTADDTSKKLIVSYPAATIQDVNIDNDSFKRYSEKEGLWNSFSIKDYNEAQKEFKAEAEEKALEKGIIEKANTNAEETLEKLIRFTVGDEYTIVFEQQEE